MQDPTTGIKVEFLPGGPASGGAGLSSPAIQLSQTGVNLGMTALMQAWKSGSGGAGSKGTQSMLFVNSLSKNQPFPGDSPSPYLGYVGMVDGVSG